MDIRIINENGEMVNVSQLSLRVMNNVVVAYSTEQNLMTVAVCKDEREARGVLELIIGKVKRNVKGSIVVDLREKKAR